MGVRRLRGKAWGNALGGWRSQARKANGQWGSGAVRSYQKRRKTYGVARLNSGKKTYKRSDVNHSLQARHRATVTATFAGNYAGMYAGQSLGMASMGPVGGLLGGYAGAAIGNTAATEVLKGSGLYTTAKDIKAGSATDRLLIKQRNERVQRAHTVMAVGTMAYESHKILSGVGAYGRTASRIRTRKASNYRAQTHGLPRAGRGSKGSFAPRKAPRYGRNKGVYNVTSMSGTKIR